MLRLGTRLALTLLIVAAVPALAHGHAATGADAHAPGSTGTVTIAIAHGCGGEKGTLRVDRVAVLVPRGFTSIRPRALAGWRARSGRTATGTRVEWRATGGGALTPRFQMAVRFPTAKGTYALPTVQYCGRDSIAWIQRGAGAERPAPTVVVR